MKGDGITDLHEKINISRITLPYVVDAWHVHLRNGILLPFNIKHLIESGFRGGRILDEPNLIPALTSANLILARKKVVEAAIIEVAGSLEEGFEVVYTIQITEETTPEMIYTAHAIGVKVAKVYPKDVTNNSSNGVVNYENIYPALKAAQECGMIVQFHGEHPSHDIEGPKKETAFIFRILSEIVSHPDLKHLKISLEHVSTAFGVHWVRAQNPNSSASPRIVGALAPQYMYCTNDDVMGYTRESKYMGHSELFCKPMLKWNDDRAAIQAAATSGESRFVFGPDIAAHLDSSKGPGGASCGSWNTKECLPVLAEVFEERKALHNLPVFLDNGRRFYGYPEKQGSVVLEKQSWEVPPRFPVGGLDEWVTSMLPGRTLKWRVRC